MEFFTEFWLECLMIFLVAAKSVANLTRTDVDNKVFAIIDLAIDYLIPPRKKKVDD